MPQSRTNRSLLALVTLFGAGTLLRAWNLLRYPVDMGFDARGNGTTSRG